MPRTRNRASAAQEKVVVEEPVVEEAPAEEEQEEEEEHQSIEGGSRPLDFNESLTWRAGKPIAVAELLRRLRSLHTELSQLDQEDADRDSLVPVAQELAHRNLLEHRDRGVKAWSALCIVEMFKLLAPDAPFKAAQLNQIFSLIITQVLPALGNPQDPYNEQHLSIVRSLDEVKSIVLLTDIPGADGLLYKLFTGAFDIFADTSKNDKAEELGKNVEHHVTSLLVTVVDESPSLPNDVVDIILAQFLRLDPTTFPLQLNKAALESSRPFHLQLPPPAYNMAKNICSSCPDKMSRMVAHYFNSIIADLSDGLDGSNSRKSASRRRAGADDDEDEEDDNDRNAPPAGPSVEELKSLEKAHRLLRELWRSAALVIQNIVPQIESELAAENVDIRLLATETVGDLISGIGAAGPPTPVALDPAAYPSQSIDPPSAYTRTYNFLTTPAAPHAFSSVHASTYQGFLNRRNDKSPRVRSIWVTCAGRILSTSAGGVGLDPKEESALLRYISDMLVDTDEHVRLAAVQAIGRCDFETIVQRIGSSGSVTTPDSVLSNLADRIKDRKHSVRAEAMSLLGRIWGVAAGAITEGNERVRMLLGAIPSRIFDAIYINDREITALVQQVLYDSLLPLSYPPIKAKPAANGDSQPVKDSQIPASQVTKVPSPDAIRAERILVLVRDLEHKSKTVFFTFQARQTKMAQYLEAFLKRCEDYNGGVNAKNGKEGSGSLSKLIEFFARERPEPLVANEHLWKFAKKHDRRCYQLIRFAVNPDSEYKKVVNAIKELTKRVEEQPGHTPAILTTILPIIYQASVLVYSKSHVPTIVDISRTEDKGLGPPAHEVLREISTHNPEVFKAHVRSLCTTLQEQVHSKDKPTESGVVETLKACAGFAQRFPLEIPRERAFLQAMVQFALNGNPSIAAKHAVSVIVAADEKKDMYVKDIVTKCVQGFEYGEDGYLSKLAALSQLMLLSAKDTEDEHDNILEIAIQKVLLQVRTEAKPDDLDWQEQPDDECEAKIWALKILANRLRSYAMSVPDSEMESVVQELAEPVFKLLHRIVDKDGELSKSQSQTPKPHRARLRLNAAILILKLCSAHKRFDALVEPKNFNRLIVIAQDPLPEVRSAFVDAIKKYLGQGRLPHRYYSLVFMYAFEPIPSIKNPAFTWLKGRAAAFARSNETVMETTFARFISLLAHHPDFSMDAENLQDFIDYLMFYLKAVATPANIPLIYHIAQKMKSVRDGIDEEKSDNLYCLSDMAQAVIHRYQELQGWTLSVWSGKIRLPAVLFSGLPGHTVAQEIADKQYVPEKLMEQIEDLVRDRLRTKKRKSETTNTQARKRARASEGKSSKATAKKVKSVKTPKKRRASNATASVPASEIRRSSRKSGAKIYLEESGSDEEEAEELDEADEDDSNDEESEAEDQEMDDVEEQEPEQAKAGSEEPEQETVEPEEVEEEPEEEAVEAPAPPQSRRSGRAAPNGKKPAPAAPKGKKAAPAAATPKRSSRRKKNGAASDSELSAAPSDME
jgi:sister-chromatid-cohesion protein PDS5